MILFKYVSQGECIIASGTPDVTTGYIRKSRFNKIHYAHRLAYSDAHGDIPEGLQIHHTCDNKLCINASHLRAVTKAEHQVIHSHPKSAAYYEQLTTCKKGHLLDGRNSKQRYCKTCHKESNLRWLKKRELQYDFV